MRPVGKASQLERRVLQARPQFTWFSTTISPAHRFKSNDLLRAASGGKVPSPPTIARNRHQEPDHGHRNPTGEVNPFAHGETEAQEVHLPRVLRRVETDQGS